MPNFAYLWELGGVPLYALLVLAAVSTAIIFREILLRLQGSPFCSARLPVLQVLAAIAPLIGLLGTVMGLVRVFGSNVSAETVASGISQALLTTQIGLIIAVPLLIIRQLLLRWADKQIKLYSEPGQKT